MREWAHNHPFLAGFAGAIVGVLVFFLAWTAYLDHQNLKALVQIRLQEVQQAQGPGK